jgi:uncharacterized membrane protein YhaH (DUF805 family)
MHWLIDPIRFHYADFNGRASRREYWMFLLMYMVVFVPVIVLIGFMSAVMSANAGEGFALIGIALVFVLLMSVIVPSIAIQVRRLHDIGKSGWWYLLSFVPYIGGIILLILSAQPSQVGTNAYGPNPYGIEYAPVPQPDNQSPAPPVA